MPSQEKKRWAQLRVGLLAAAALVIFAVLVFLLTSSRGFMKSRTDIYTFISDSAAVAIGSPVRLNGVDVGRIGAVALSGSAEPTRVIKVTLQINEEFMSSIPVDSQAAIAAENILGTKYINITKGRSPETVKAGSEIKSLDTRDIQDVVQQGYGALASLDAILKKVDTVINDIQGGKGTIGQLLSDDTLYKHVLDITNQAQKLAETLNSDQGTLGKLLHDQQLYDDLRGTVTRVNTLVDDLQQGQGTAGKLLKDPALYDDTRATIAETRGALADVRKLIAGLNDGQGTAGKLLKSDDLHNQLQATMGRLDSLLDKVNNGQGTLGQLVLNPALYESLDVTTREMNGLLKDFRANPKKFLRIKLAIF
jgi:phospholipid/cholesterol/gamma-HCH transport system substrate-binding protein